MKKIKALLYYIVELIMSVLIVGIINVSILKVTLYNEDYIKKLFIDNNYYDYIDKEIKNEMTNNIIPTQLPESVLDNIYTKEDIENEINNIISCMYNNKKIEINTDKVSENIRNSINKYINENNIKVDNEKALNKIVVQMTDIYKSKMTQSSIYNKIQKLISKTNKYIDILLIALITGFILLYIFSFILRREYNLSLCLLTSSFINIVSIIYLKSNINLNNIYLWDDKISELIHIVGNNIINLSFTISIILIVLAILIILIKRVKKKALSKR